MKIKTVKSDLSPFALIIVPTRELGVQVKDHLDKIIFDLEENTNKKSNKENSKKRTYFDMKIASILGGFAKEKQLKILKKFAPEILIATPGRLWEIIENREVDLINCFQNLKYLVIDEADRMMEKGHFKELRKILNFVYIKVGNQNESISKIEKIQEYLNKFGERADDGEYGNNKIKELLSEKNIEFDEGQLIEELDPLEIIKNIGEDELTLDHNIQNIKDDDDLEENEVEDDNEIKENVFEEKKKDKSKKLKILKLKNKLN